MRLHYGHPDLWNRHFSMTRGGVSKANAVQHVSEDVFGGMNAMKRGGLSKYVSYISVGKGRDMGLDSILGFEGKVGFSCFFGGVCVGACVEWVGEGGKAGQRAPPSRPATHTPACHVGILPLRPCTLPPSLLWTRLAAPPQISKGCAEQLMSRDVRFLGTYLDFFRAMSMYHTGGLRLGACLACRAEGGWSAGIVAMYYAWPARGDGGLAWRHRLGLSTVRWIGRRYHCLQLWLAATDSGVRPARPTRPPPSLPCVRLPQAPGTSSTRPSPSAPSSWACGCSCCCCSEASAARPGGTLPLQRHLATVRFLTLSHLLESPCLRPRRLLPALHTPLVPPPPPPRTTTPSSARARAPPPRSVSTALGAIQILQLGTLPLLGHLFNLWVEAGLAVALGTLFRQFIAGGLLFYIVRWVVRLVPDPAPPLPAAAASVEPAC